jgi:hypothetical protein
MGDVSRGQNKDDTLSEYVFAKNSLHTSLTNQC